LKTSTINYILLFDHYCDKVIVTENRHTAPLLAAAIDLEIVKRRLPNNLQRSLKLYRGLTKLTLLQVFCDHFSMGPFTVLNDSRDEILFKTVVEFLLRNV